MIIASDNAFQSEDVSDLPSRLDLRRILHRCGAGAVEGDNLVIRAWSGVPIDQMADRQTGFYTMAVNTTPEGVNYVACRHISSWMTILACINNNGAAVGLPDTAKIGQGLLRTVKQEILKGPIGNVIDGLEERHKVDKFAGKIPNFRIPEFEYAEFVEAQKVPEAAASSVQFQEQVAVSNFAGTKPDQQWTEPVTEEGKKLGDLPSEVKFDKDFQAERDEVMEDANNNPFHPIGLVPEVPDFPPLPEPGKAPALKGDGKNPSADLELARVKAQAKAPDRDLVVSSFEDSSRFPQQSFVRSSSPPPSTRRQNILSYEGWKKCDKVDKKVGNHEDKEGDVYPAKAQKVKAPLLGLTGDDLRKELDALKPKVFHPWEVDELKAQGVGTPKPRKFSQARQDRKDKAREAKRQEAKANAKLLTAGSRQVHEEPEWESGPASSAKTEVVVASGVPSSGTATATKSPLTSWASVAKVRTEEEKSSDVEMMDVSANDKTKAPAEVKSKEDPKARDGRRKRQGRHGQQQPTKVDDNSSRSYAAAAATPPPKSVSESVDYGQLSALEAAYKAKKKESEDAATALSLMKAASVVQGAERQLLEQELIRFRKRSSSEASSISQGGSSKTSKTTSSKASATVTSGAFEAEQSVFKPSGSNTPVVSVPEASRPNKRTFDRVSIVGPPDDSSVEPPAKKEPPIFCNTERLRQYWQTLQNAKEQFYAELRRKRKKRKEQEAARLKAVAAAEAAAKGRKRSKSKKKSSSKKTSSKATASGGSKPATPKSTSSSLKTARESTSVKTASTASSGSSPSVARRSAGPSSREAAPSLPPEVNEKTGKKRSLRQRERLAAWRQRCEQAKHDRVSQAKPPEPSSPEADQA